LLPSFLLSFYEPEPPSYLFLLGEEDKSKPEATLEAERMTISVTFPQFKAQVCSQGNNPPLFPINTLSQAASKGWWEQDGGTISMKDSQ